VKGFLKRTLGWIERRLFAQLHARLTEIDGRLDTVSARLDALQRRVAEAQAVVEATAARAASSTEQTLGVVESDARTARRFEEIERMLGAAPPGIR
jgi:division protein CdvB (Snf7/Vps24/ESCRT-III family)